ncbi:phage tail protein [Salmonella enterica subsp. enterica serovar Agona]|uniref:Phage tail protein n=2 Tax=Salmonella enterica I TaxID=59201 RepID=A0A5U8VJ12_SALET|nr:phage tail protein [Salmonella enterica subsp. enterica serovar Agona]EHQ4607388.1 tail fiber assembly protein [Salmonella enterica]EAB9346049.1 phage tail protein [Salmonella enterica subsp. enterica serovar Agona]EBG5973696.1 tail fiber assembly protein [Salmonella enterica subsp. enterica serovar Agona]EBR0411098.1 phage tail protein [Salmonella enterica subsp. enterica serovar Agona]
MNSVTDFSYVYDAKTNGFYAISLKDYYETAGTWPENGVEITAQEHKNLMNGQSAGKVVSADSKGRPILNDMLIDYVALATAERERRMSTVTARINELVEAQEDGDITDNELAELADLREVRTRLRRLDLTNAPHIEWPEVPEDVA